MVQDKNFNWKVLNATTQQKHTTPVTHQSTPAPPPCLPSQSSQIQLSLSVLELNKRPFRGRRLHSEAKRDLIQLIDPREFFNSSYQPGCKSQQNILYGFHLTLDWWDGVD